MVLYHLILQGSPNLHTITSSLHMRWLRPQEVKWSAQDHTATASGLKTEPEDVGLQSLWFFRRLSLVTSDMRRTVSSTWWLPQKGYRNLSESVAQPRRFRSGEKRQNRLLKTKAQTPPQAKDVSSQSLTQLPRGGGGCGDCSEPALLRSISLSSFSTCQTPV